MTRLPRFHQNNTIKTISGEGGERRIIEYRLKNSEDKWLCYEALDISGHPINIAIWIQTLISSKSERKLFLQVLRDARFDAFFFETKGTSNSNYKEKNMEFVLVEGIASEFRENGPDLNAFQEYFIENSSKKACTFENWSGDCRLITPMPPTATDHLQDFTDIAALARSFSEENIEILDSTLEMTLQEYQKRIQMVNGKSVWLSTSGLGVFWLHFRLDSRPKYYNYRNFAKET